MKIETSVSGVISDHIKSLGTREEPPDAWAKPHVKSNLTVKDANTHIGARINRNPDDSDLAAVSNVNTAAAENTNHDKCQSKLNRYGNGGDEIVVNTEEEMDLR